MTIINKSGVRVRHKERIDERTIRVWYADGKVLDFDVDDYNYEHEVVE